MKEDGCQDLTERSESIWTDLSINELEHLGNTCIRRVYSL